MDEPEKTQSPAPDGPPPKRHPANRAGKGARRIAKELVDPAPDGIHPALIPGLGVEQTNRVFRTDRVVFTVALLFTVGFITWGIVAGDSLASFASGALDWVITYTGWFFTSIATVVLVFMLWVGFGRFGRIRLGTDDEKPEFSMFSWISMLFAAGMGIGLVFWGAAEPLTFFESPPPGSAEAGTVEAMHTALTQVLYHWGPQAWAFYALIGGAIAYGAYRRGRLPLISSIFAPLLGEHRTSGPIGKTIDIFAIIVTLFGTAASLGLGALQIGHGVEIIAGVGPVGNGLLIGVITVLTIAFIISAVSGVSRGIRALSNINAAVAMLLALFVFFVGPTMLILQVIPSVAAQFVGDLPQMIARSGSQGEEAQAFLSAWTIFYWAWWISWSPFVGMFIAKVSRGRTLRQFVSVVVIVPSAVSFLWFAIFGTTAIDDQMNGANLPVSPSEEVLFNVLADLPLAGITTVIAAVLVAIFFVTGADSASLVMGTLSQQGKPDPSRWVTIVWGTLVGAIAAVLLVAGGEEGGGLQALQNVTIVAALPFAIIMAFMMIAFTKDLRSDPLIMRDAYAERAVRHSVRVGLEEHGDDFALAAVKYDHSQDDLAWVEPKVDEALVETYTAAIDVIEPADDSGAEAPVDATEPAETTGTTMGGAPAQQPAAPPKVHGRRSASAIEPSTGAIGLPGRADADRSAAEGAAPGGVSDPELPKRRGERDPE
ncbi:BCCT family transporter [Arenivirga flava]|uniref:Choline transporter n=1 Tax=Arenivirga flava TaxID=1930060 RepID=A0AA37UHT2_9MICO|nr:BCCT family transporter [Arenivirga flava]GMA29485.1 choline transporter [Arenivirga flava]